MVQTARRRFYWKNLHVCLAMATRPRITRRMISRWRNLFAGTRLESQTTSIEASYALLLLAVSADARGTGLALKLVEAFEGTLTKPCRYQISVARNNLAAIRFYQKINCKVTKESRDTLQ
ncbi:MAG: GNAT family N-acetyltransferase, partial [Desulfomonile tiedjei]|nr:GNAT family N-acetyltransferase [Desulfomonile tiedjei]